MLTYSFEPSAAEPLYEQLYIFLKNDILSGTIRPGEKLPSKRTFAKNLGISIITIESAYDQLMTEGFIYSLPKKGFYVSEIQWTAAPKKTPRHGSMYGSHGQSAARLGDAGDISQSLTDGSPAACDASSYIVDFTNNHVPAEKFPSSVWSRLIRSALLDSKNEMLTSSPGTGLISLRESIAEHMREFRGLNVSPEQIVVGSGTEYLYGQIVCLLGRDLIYGIEDPGYHKIRLIYEINGAGCRQIPLDQDGIIISSLTDQDVDIAHISPSHHFPTGIVTPVSRRCDLLRWASGSFARYIIEDDYDSEFRMAGRPLPTLASIDTSEKVIYMNTFSKSISPSLRVSYMILPPHLTKRYQETMSFYNCPVPNVIQSALSRFISSGAFEKHINRMRQFYKKQRNLLISEIENSRLRDAVSISEADSGLHFILDLKISCSDARFKEQMSNMGIRINALSDYYFKPKDQSTHRFVINYSSLTEDEIRKSVRIMSEAVTALSRLS